jgi:hypothetical protein
MKIAFRRYAPVLLVLVVTALFAAAQNPPALPASDMIFDVRNGDQQGKLILKDDEVAFESLTDAKHSRQWKYADIRELLRSKNELRIQPFHGDKYAFQFRKKEMRDRLYDLISNRIVATRQAPR